MSDEVARAFKDTGANFWATFLTAVVIAPGCEELLFRGWMLRGFRVHYSERKAILASSAIFALLHLNPWQAIVAFPIGIFFAWLTVRTGSILPGLVGHAAVNGFFVVLMPVALAALGWGGSDLENLRRSSTDLAFVAGWLLTAAVCIAIGVWSLRRSLPKSV